VSGHVLLDVGVAGVLLLPDLVVLEHGVVG
jgi:hypothetical protein